VRRHVAINRQCLDLIGKAHVHNCRWMTYFSRHVQDLTVSVMICRQALMRAPANGRSLAKRSRSIRSSGISVDTHSMHSRPCSASDRLLMSGHF